MTVTVVQVRDVRVRMDDRGVTVRMGVLPRNRDLLPVFVLMVRVVRVGVIVLHFLVGVRVVVSLEQQESQPGGHEPHRQEIGAA